MVLWSSAALCSFNSKGSRSHLEKLLQSILLDFNGFFATQQIWHQGVQAMISQCFTRMSYRTLLISVVALTACQHREITSASIEKPATSMFSEITGDFKAEAKNRQKFDNPVVADLDQDGWPDILANDHTWGVQVFWNNEGQFASGVSVLMGDSHGIAVGDYDGDGQADIVITRGGGGGKNPRINEFYTVGKNRQFIRKAPFTEALKAGRGRLAKFLDVDNDGDQDLFMLNYPSNQRVPGGENYLYENIGKGELIYKGKLPPTPQNGERALVTDFNGDGIMDIIYYSEGSIRLLQGGSGLAFNDVTTQMLSLPIDDVTDIAEIDFDNDGDFDLYLTRGKQIRIGETFYDPATQTFAFFSMRKPFNFPDLQIGETFNMINYQAPYPDKKIFIGEASTPLKREGEQHSGFNFSLVSSNALGLPESMIEKGIYISYTGDGKWQISGDSFVQVSGVITGVKSLTSPSHEPAPGGILLENRDGKFVDITKAAGLTQTDHTTGVTVGDFDNNGFADLMVIKRGDLAKSNEHLLYLNLGNSQFKKTNGHGVMTHELGAIGQGVTALDYNRDGRLDIAFGLERGQWHIFKGLSQLTSHAKYLTVDVGRSPNMAAHPLNALVSISGCGITRVAHVGSTGGQYSQSADTMIHFGMGNCDLADRITVKWSNGESSAIDNSKTNQIVKIGQAIGTALK